ncbi:type II toxin-antitoxin system VapC family toxin [Rhizobium sp. CG5]|uniref:type II toxin-antitoxin system VapC family toxin n=1 Tax=Rhizobium sp. CG5 TaxID=2726076 RepID=UPI0020341E4B|nr:type II toxin-antitoxin system VapC family toxin [Rhizobium sp. CG5]MCM2473637.1 type II toxin-antitoxin system VapC family toxin [Rhizobium sp. CG5]
METFGKIYLDTNLFIMAFENRGRESGLISDIFAAVAMSSAQVFATSELTLSELIVKPLRAKDEGAVAQYGALIRSSAWLDVRQVVRDVLVVAAMLRTENSAVKLPDAIHLSTAFAAGCSHILTDDRGLKGEYVAGPHVARSWPDARALVVLRPDEPTLTSLLQSLAA